MSKKTHVIASNNIKIIKPRTSHKFFISIVVHRYASKHSYSNPFPVLQCYWGVPLENLRLGKYINSYIDIALHSTGFRPYAHILFEMRKIAWPRLITNCWYFELVLCDTRLRTNVYSYERTRSYELKHEFAHTCTGTARVTMTRIGIRSCKTPEKFVWFVIALIDMRGIHLS